MRGQTHDVVSAKCQGGNNMSQEAEKCLRPLTVSIRGAGNAPLRRLLKWKLR